ncbi:MAG: DUF2298 domain-containing protein [Chloroflexia bacterium]
MITLELLGIVALPIAMTLLGGLPDRGYASAKVLGLLLTVWLAYNISMLHVGAYGRLLLALCALAVAVLSAWLLLRDKRSLWTRLRGLLRERSFVYYLIAAEAIFLLAFISWAVLRAYDPDIFGTEKFMDFGFMNAIAKSSTFPPNDPWLSGNSINYYYFGYVLMTSLTLLSGVPTQVGFNLANVTLFALTALGTFGVAFNMVALTMGRRTGRRAAGKKARGVSRATRDGDGAAEVPSAPPPVAGPSRRGASGSRSNRAEPAVAEARAARALAVEAPRHNKASMSASGVVEGSANGQVSAQADGPEHAATSPVTSRYAYEQYTAEPVIPRKAAPYLTGLVAALMVVAMGNLTTMFAVHDGPQMEGDGWRYCFMCQTTTNFNWFAPSRIIQDYRMVPGAGGVSQKQTFGVQTINEFPAFSFLLADLHPHVMSLPLVLLALVCALAFTQRRIRRAERWLDGLPAGVTGWLVLLLGGIVAGALYTANTWDFPTYLLLMVLGLALAYLAHQGRGSEPRRWQWVKPWIVQSVLLAALSILAYVTFQLTFKSPVGAQDQPLPEGLARIPVVGWLLSKVGALLALNPADKSIVGFLVVFGIFLAILIGWLLYELISYWARRRQQIALEGRFYDPAVTGAAILVVLLLAVLLRFPLLGLLLPLGVIPLYLIWREPQHIERNFALVVLSVGAFIGLFVEVFYLRDVFNDRQNTLFKFYYQMWVLWGVVSAYGGWRVLSAAFRRAQVTRGAEPAPYAMPAAARAISFLWAAVAGLLVLSGLMYSVYGPLGKLGPNASLHGLDGATYMSRSAPADYEAINWLKDHGTGKDVVLECCRDEYNNPGYAGRVSSYTGVPTLLSWDGHENQWRGGQSALLGELGPRRALVDALYKGVSPDGGDTLTADELLNVLHRYGVTYVFAGAVERGEGAAAGGFPEERLTPYAEAVFKQALPEAFRSGNTVVYAVKQGIAGTGQAPAPATGPGTPQPEASGPPAGLFDLGQAGVGKGRFNLPRGIARDAQGNFYVADTQNERIQKFDPSGKWLASFGSKGNGNGQFAAISAEAQGTGPGGVAVDAQGNVYVADTWNHRIQKFNPDGRFLTTWGSFLSLSDPNSANEANKDKRFYGPRGVAVGPDGSVYVADTGNKRVLVFDAEGNPKRQIADGASPERVAPQYPYNKPGELNEPMGIAVDKSRNVYVADTNNHRIQKFDSSGKYATSWDLPQGSWDPGQYLEPFLAVDAEGNVYATAPTTKTVLKYSPDGKLLGQKKGAGDKSLLLPTGIAVAPDGTVYVVDTLGNGVLNLGKIP